MGRFIPTYVGIRPDPCHRVRKKVDVQQSHAMCIQPQYRRISNDLLETSNSILFSQGADSRARSSMQRYSVSSSPHNRLTLPKLAARWQAKVVPTMEKCLWTFLGQPPLCPNQAPPGHCWSLKWVIQVWLIHWKLIHAASSNELPDRSLDQGKSAGVGSLHIHLLNRKQRTHRSGRTTHTLDNSCWPCLVSLRATARWTGPTGFGASPHTRERADVNTANSLQPRVILVIIGRNQV